MILLSKEQKYDSKTTYQIMWKPKCMTYHTGFLCSFPSTVTGAVLGFAFIIIHYSDATLSAMVSQITGVLIVCLAVCSGAHKKHQSSASLAFLRRFHRWLVESPRKGPVTREMFPFDDVIMVWDDFIWFHSQCLMAISAHSTNWCLRSFISACTVPRWSLGMDK